MEKAVLNERIKRQSVKQQAGIHEIITTNLMEQNKTADKNHVSEGVSDLVKKIGDVDGVNAIDINRKMPMDSFVRQY